MTIRQKFVTLTIVLLILALFIVGPTAAFAHHNGKNPDIGNINEEMVHSGLMENASGMAQEDVNWDDVPDVDPPGELYLNQGGEQVQQGR
jgi:hypothetical protein